MTTDNETILASANKMIDRYGATALDEVDQRIDELQNRGEDDACGLWKKIRAVVVILSDDKCSKTMH